MSKNNRHLLTGQSIPGAPPSGQWVVVCVAYRDGGVAPTGTRPCILCEPRPRGDGSWSARVIATGASLLQGQGPAFCVNPALGAMGGGMQGFSRRGRRSYKKVWTCVLLGNYRPRGGLLQGQQGNRPRGGLVQKNFR